MSQNLEPSDVVFYFQEPFSGWMPTSIFKNMYIQYKQKYNITNDCTIHYNNNCSSPTSPHHLIIKNIHHKKYKIITYWDNAIDLMDDIHGWDNNNCLGIYSCVDASLNNKIIPTSYCCYNQDIEYLINNIEYNFNQKTNNKLYFRGYLYGSRHLDTNNQNVIFLTNERLSYKNYIEELNSYQICLSLNGAAEICNRDMEILGVGSVLLRPKFSRTIFHNPLIENVHYIGFDTSDNPKEQTEIILHRYSEIINDKDHLHYIASNGKQWYNDNATCQSNVKILDSVLKLEELFL